MERWLSISLIICMLLLIVGCGEHTPSVDTANTHPPADADVVLTINKDNGNEVVFGIGTELDPHFFSAIAPICGGGMAWRTGSLKGMPIWAFHGDKDTSVSISNSEEMIARVRNHTPAKFTVFEGVSHNSWDPAYLQTNVVDWLLSQNRKQRI